MILTTTPAIEGHTIREYKGVVFGEVITGVNFLKDFAASIRDSRDHRLESGRMMMPVTVRMNHAVADGYLISKVFLLLEEEMKSFVIGQ